MTKRYPLRGAFCGGNSGDAGDFEGIALGIFEAADGCYYFRLHFYEGVGFGGARSYSFGGDVDHLHFAAGGVVRKSWHRLLYANKSKELTQRALRACPRGQAQRSQRGCFKLRPFAAVLGRFLQHRRDCGLRRLPRNSLPALKLLCRLNLARAELLLLELRHAIRPWRGENV